MMRRSASSSVSWTWKSNACRAKQTRGRGERHASFTDNSASPPDDRDGPSAGLDGHTTADGTAGSGGSFHPLPVTARAGLCHSAPARGTPSALVYPYAHHHHG